MNNVHTRDRMRVHVIKTLHDCKRCNAIPRVSRQAHAHAGNGRTTSLPNATPARSGPTTDRGYDNVDARAVVRRRADARLRRALATPRTSARPLPAN